MSEDVILAEFMQAERWEKAINAGLAKKIDKATLELMTTPDGRTKIMELIYAGKYRIAPPHMAQIPKDTPGEFRTVFVNEGMDRVVLSIINDMLFDMFPEMIHENCVSYRRGIGCGKIVRGLSDCIVEAGKTRHVIGWKSDLSKYFDSVPIEYIDKVFDDIEAKKGKSAVVDMVRDYYHSDDCFDMDGKLVSKFQSLKQGCAVAAFLADAVLYHIDEALSALKGRYVRYSDDCLFIGGEFAKGMAVMRAELGRMGMLLNPKKVEQVTSDHWVKFLGFCLKGDKITMSPRRIKTFQREIEERCRKKTYAQALAGVNRFLYRGFGGHSWATGVLSVINVKSDIDTLNGFVMDSLRSCVTGKTRIGGLGFCPPRCEAVGFDGAISRGKGRNVSSNRLKVPVLEGYRSLGCMRNALRLGRPTFDTIVRSL